MTKDQISDLQSLIERAKQCAVGFRNAELAKAEADRQLESFLFSVKDKS